MEMHWYLEKKLPPRDTWSTVELQVISPEELLSAPATELRLRKDGPKTYLSKMKPIVKSPAGWRY